MVEKGTLWHWVEYQAVFDQVQISVVHAQALGTPSSGIPMALDDT